jgi:hypothetical protein
MIFGPIKFLMKLIILFMIFIMFVVFHNTEFGEKVERQIGEALEYENLRKTGFDLYRKVTGSSTVEKINAKKLRKKFKKQIDSLQESDAVKKLPAKAEKIVEKERKRLEDIIEGGG